jgi:putative ABC transport system permease protein
MVGGIAALIALALGLNRLLRRDTSDTATLAALGASRTELRLANLCAALTVGVPSAVVATVVCFVLSPFGPVGLARRAETNIGLRFDVTVAACSTLAILALSAVVGGTTRIGNARLRPRRVREPSLVRRSTARLGAVPRAGSALLAGGSPGAAIVVVAVAIGAMVASAGLVASFDRVEHHPARYGAWWDVVVGDYSDANALNAGIDAIRRNPNVQTAATLGDSDARINGKPAVLISISKVIGSVPSTVFSGRAPTSPSEIALGADLAESLHVRVGGTVSVEARDSDAAATRFTVVGLVVLDNPTSLDVSPGDGALVTQAALGSPGDQIDQEILVRFNPSIGSGQALHSILDQFHAFVVRATPESDVSNLGRIRAVPWYIAALLGLLALATFAHSIVTALRRHRTELAVLAALGMTRRQLRGVTVCSAVAMVLASCVLGLIIGAAGGPALWYLLANRLGLASGPVVTALPIAVVITAAIALTGLIAGVAQAWRTHRGTTDPLRET